MLTQVVPFPHVQDHIHRQPPLGHELAFGHDTRHLALDPQVGLDLLQVSGGHDLDLLGPVEDDPAVLAPGLHLGRAVNQNAGAGEVEDIVGVALEGIVAAGDPDQAAGLENRTHSYLVFGSDDDLGVTGFAAEIVIDGADEAAGLGVSDVFHLTAGDNVSFDLTVVLGIDLDRTVILMGGDLAGSLDAHTDIRTDIGMFDRVDVGKVDIVSGSNVAAGIEDVAEEGVNSRGLEGRGAAQGDHRGAGDIGHAQHGNVARTPVQLELIGIGEDQAAGLGHDPEIVEHRIIQLVVE